MPSYYKRVKGIEPNTLAESEHVNEIQSNIENSQKEAIVDLHGDAFIYDSDEDAFKLTPASSYIDQININYNHEGDQYGSSSSLCWFSLYNQYIRQSIRITKSGIETISVHIKNGTDLKVPVYAEIRDENNKLIKATSANLLPSNEVSQESDDNFQNIVFNFNVQNLLVGDYFFVINPISISVANLNTGPEYNEITENDFLIRFDIDGTYHRNVDEGSDKLVGLEASIDGANYMPAYMLNNQDEYDEVILSDPNYDLYFEETYSSGVTYLLENAGTAIIDGEKVTSFSTHVKINGPSSNDRIDLVYLDKNGELNVQEGVSGGDAPIKDKALYIAYITTYSDTSKLPVVNQDDTSNTVRKRSLLERVRRVEKQNDYQFKNNTISRIKYNCEVDPTMFNNGLGDTIYGEGTRGMGISENEYDDDVIVNKGSHVFTWSLIDDIHKYSYEVKDKESYVQIFDVVMPERQPKTATARVFQYTAFISDDKITSNSNAKAGVKNPIAGQKIDIYIKKGDRVKHTTSVVTDSKGKAATTFYSAKLSPGNYTIISVVGKKKIKNKLTIKNTSYLVKTPSCVQEKVAISTYDTVTKKVNLPNNVFSGNDSFIFDSSEINLDTKKGSVTLAKVNTNKKSEYEKNDKLSPGGRFKSEVVQYDIYDKSKEKASNFPAMHLDLPDTYIDAIGISNIKFKHIKAVGLLIFKNDSVNKLRTHKRKTVVKNVNDNKIYTNVYHERVSLGGITTSNKKKERVLNSGESIKFDVNKKVEAGTYTAILYGILSDKAEEGYIGLREFDVHGNFDKYGITAQTIGSSNLSTFTMNCGGTKSTTWNLIIKQRPTIYARRGTITSSPKVTEEPIVSCRVKKHLRDDVNADAHLFVSNNGGVDWQPADDKNVKFNSSGNVFQWKLEMTSTDGKHTPALLYKESKDINKKYAIRFRINTTLQFVEYEDYQKCYETPLLNANSITRTFAANDLVSGRFSEWEFARIFMLDEELKSKVDICISYAEDASTNVSTRKPDWDKKIFFNQIFADLLLSDFSTDSVDYDNYDPLVEFDEHNYRFKMESEYVMHNNSGIVVATPTDESLTYGLINDDNVNIILNEKFEAVTDGTDDKGNVFTKYEYVGNETNEQAQYSGTHIVSGPYKKVTFNPTKTDKTTTYGNDKSNQLLDNENISNNYSFDFEKCKKATIFIGNQESNYIKFEYTNNDDPTLQISIYNNKTLINANQQPIQIKGYQYFTFDGTRIIYNKSNNTVRNIYEGITKPEIQHNIISKYILNDGNSTSDTFDIIQHGSTGTGTTSTASALPDNVIHYNSTDLPNHYSNDYVINGIRFDSPLEVDESRSTLSIQVYMDAAYKTLKDGEKRTFPPGTFDVVVSLDKYGTAQSSNDGRAYTVNSPLSIGGFSTINIDISDNLDAYSASGISSIGIRVKDTDNFVEGDSIGLGWVSTDAYNRRPYTQYTYTQNWERIRWERYNQDLGQSASAIVTAKRNNDNDAPYYHFLYPINIDKNGESSDSVTKTQEEIKRSGSVDAQHAYEANRGTAFNNDNPIATTSVTRNKSTFTFNNEYTSTNSGNQILFNIPAQTGKLFKINTNIPFRIYDLIDIEYYIKSLSVQNTNHVIASEGNGGGTNQANVTHDVDCLDTYTGSFSKGDIIIHLYDVTDVTDDTVPIESFALPSWGYQATKANVSNKIVHAWFKKRSSADMVRSIVIERKNPTNTEMFDIDLVLNNILFFNAETMPALGPQMQMRIYPNTGDGSLEDIQIRKIGCIYRL